MTDEMVDELVERAENCRLALKVAMTDYCGAAPTGEGEFHTVKVAGVEIEVPEELHEIAIQEERSLGERQIEIERSGWVRDMAAELCTAWGKAFAPPDGAPMDGEAVGACITRTAAEIGARILEGRSAGEWSGSWTKK